MDISLVTVAGCESECVDQQSGRRRSTSAVGSRRALGAHSKRRGHFTDQCLKSHCRQQGWVCIVSTDRIRIIPALRRRL